MGGVENVAQAVCSRLVASGEDVLVVCADEPRGAPDVGDGVPIRRLGWVAKIANTNITPRLPLVLFSEPWDVVHTHLPTPWSADWSVLIARLLRRGSVLSFYNDIVGEGFADRVARLYRSTVLRLTLGLADRIIVVSDYWRDELLALDPGLGGKLAVIPTGVDLHRFTPGPGGDGRQLLFVGLLDRFHRYKGLAVLFDALSMIRDPFELTVVGDGELRPEYEAQVAHLGLSAHVRFVGRVEDDELSALYARSDIYILPSEVARQEGGFTLTALEAMASGVAVILADGAGQVARDAERDGAGLRVPSGDAAALAEALERLLRNDEERRQMRVAARQLVAARHSWDQIARDRRAIYLEVAEAARQRRARRRRL